MCVCVWPVNCDCVLYVSTVRAVGIFITLVLCMLPMRCVCAAGVKYVR